jgi:hypothetical protein
LILTSLCLLLVGCSKERRAERLAAKLGDPFGFAEVDDLVKIGPPAVEPLIAEGRTRFSWLRAGYEVVTKKRNQVAGE